VRLFAGATLAVAVVVTIAIARSSDAWSSMALLVLAVVLGAELRVSAARAVPPIAAAVVAASVVVDSADVVTVAVLVGATVAATAWALARTTGVTPAVVAIGGAAIGGAVCGGVLVAEPAGTSLVAEIMNTAAAAALFMATALLVSRRGRDAWAGVLWTTPIVLVAVLLANAWNALGVAGAVVLAVGVLVVLAGTAWVAAPPWDSRCLGRVLGTRCRCRARVAVFALSAAALAAGQLALADAGRSRAVWVLAAAACAESLIAMTLGAVRQWRFAPAPRIRSALALGVLAILAVLAYVPLADNGSGWSIVCLAGVLVGTAAIAWPLARFTDARTLAVR
jgi:hypothetical protein